MKRNILLLTAVVLAAVMLTGCILPFMGIKVSYDLEEEIFTDAKLTTKVKKGSLFEPEFLFAEDVEDLTFESFDIAVLAGETEVEFEAADVLNEEEAVIGIEISIPDVGKKDIKITVTLKDAGDDVVDGE